MEKSSDGKGVPNDADGTAQTKGPNGRVQKRAGRETVKRAESGKKERMR